MEELHPTLFTIGSSGTTAAHFFSRLRAAGVRTVFDVRLRRSGQLAGFAKAPDLEYLLTELAGIGYHALPAFAPSAELLRAYRAGTCGWDAYAGAYLMLLRERNAAMALGDGIIAGSCLLCAEPAADRCHRRIAADYLAGAFPPLSIVHL